MSHHTLLHRIAAPAVPLLARLGIHPGAVTLARLGLGLWGAWLIAGGAQAAAGAAIVLVSLLVDRMDGALARLTGRESRFGHWLDVCCDAVATLALLAGMIQLAGLRDAQGEAPWLEGLVLLGACLGLYGVTMVTDARRAEGPQGTALIAGWLDADDLLVVAPLAVLLGLERLVLAVGAVVAPLARAGMVLALGVGRGRAWLRRRAARAGRGDPS